MTDVAYRERGNKIIIYTRGRLCESGDELLQSGLFARMLNRFIDELSSQESRLLDIFEGDVTDGNREILRKTLKSLSHMDGSSIPKIIEGSGQFFRNTSLLNEFVEQFYNYWRNFERYVICDSEGDTLDHRPYRTFNQTIETLTRLVLAVYRDIQENITGTHPRIYRQLPAGARIGAICIPKNIPYPAGSSGKLSGILIIRQILMTPPVILEPKNNKRAGTFKKINENPLDLFEINSTDWICYPAKVGELLILIYAHETFYDLAFSLCNLFELAGDDDLQRKPDAVYLFGVPGNSLDRFDEIPAVFFDDEKNGMMIAACPDRDIFGYFGFLKKMVLTMHNAIMIKRGRLPFHGALVRIMLKNGKDSTILLMGDTGAGKSETIEAFRKMGREYLRDMIIIADDMGSLELRDNGDIMAYGTETGAFLRIDDLKPGYAFGQLDRSIMMSPDKTNARIILPVTTYETVIKGHRVDILLYANNYEQVDEEHPVIERFSTVEHAFTLFREGTVMSKGTTATTGIVHSYFANIFGPPQYRELHDPLALKFFNAFFAKGIFVGQMRTRLGIPGYEITGPEEAAMNLMKIISAG